MDDFIKKIREIRKSHDIELKPSPYLRDTYVDEYGDEQPVRLRNYQKQHVLEMCMSPRHINGEDTGLGKTLEVLTTIGYIWLKEPNYVPIVITKKSSLFQWEAETRKFMKDMGAVTVDGPPHDRAAIYEDFFLNHDPSKKRLIILTYDMLLRDMDGAVIRDRNVKPSKGNNKAMREARKVLKAAKDERDEYLGSFKDHFDGRPASFFVYVKARMTPSDKGAKGPKPPRNWDRYDEDVLIHMTILRNAVLRADEEVERLKDLVAPPLVTPGIHNLVREMMSQHKDAKVMLVMDEIHVLKNYRGKMHKAAAKLAEVSERVVGMTATPVKNRLMEFFGLFRLIHPPLFPKVTHFQDNYCIVKMQKVSGGRRVPIIVGHSKDQLSRFVDRVEPYYLSRRKHEVAEELPQLVTRELTCELSPDQEELYDIAELGLLNKADDADASPAEMLSSMVMVQQACNAPQLLADEDGNQFQGESSKLSTLEDLFSEELAGVKTIVFSRFEKMVSLIEARLDKADVKCVRITGKESRARDREASKNLFQDVGSGVDVILITTAGSESINLQAAEHIIFVDSPWSAGDYLQIVGRMVRIGSVHKMVMVTHLIAQRKSGKNTIDHYVLKVLRSKKKLMDTVAGNGLLGAFSFVNDVDELFNLMKLGRASSDRTTRKGLIQSGREPDASRAPDKPGDKLVPIPDIDLDSL